MKTFEEKIKETVPTLVAFLHNGSQDVVEVKYLSQELKEKYGDRANITRVDDHHGKLKLAYKLEEYPTWIVYKEGQELMRESGRKSLSQLEDMIERSL